MRTRSLASFLATLVTLFAACDAPQGVLGLRELDVAALTNTVEAELRQRRPLAAAAQNRAIAEQLVASYAALTLELLADGTAVLRSPTMGEEKGTWSQSSERLIVKVKVEGKPQTYTSRLVGDDIFFLMPVGELRVEAVLRRRT